MNSFGAPVLRVAAILTVAVAALVFAACSDGEPEESELPPISRQTTPQPLGSGETQIFDVTISGSAFSPRRIETGAGAPVRLRVKNNDNVTHTLDIQNGPVSGPIFAGFETEVAITTPEGSGRIAFFCSIHGRSAMNGTIVYQ